MDAEKHKYMYIGIEISAACNAKCPWCFAIKASDEGKLSQNDFMNFDTFRSVIERIGKMGFLQKDIIINLYAIGEPFLNRDILKITGYLDKKNLRYAISTNASIPLLFKGEKNILRNLSNLIISLPGFSQESYNRVHGFRFNKIQENIVRLVKNLRRNGFKGDARLVYHVYQFNLGELYKAKKFAQEINIDFYPYYAILYEYRHVRDYLIGTLPYDLLQKASKELFLANIEKTILSRPPDYVCDFFNMLLIDIDANLKTCCQIRKGDPGYSFGNIFNLSAEEIIKKRAAQLICEECQKLGLDYYLSVYTPFDLSIENPVPPQDGGAYKDLINLLKTNNEKEIVLFGAGRVGMKVLERLRDENIKVRFFSDNSPLKIGKKIGGVQVIAPGDISALCSNPLIIITTINHRQIMNQLAQLRIGPVHYFPVDIYNSPNIK
jgi:MoaA/NifB/PqqE/SkfB family radical SAM enzyme